MDHVLLMVTQSASREIHVRVRDGDGALLRGSTISWTENGNARGRADPSDGHMMLRPSSIDSIVEVSVSYCGQLQKRKLALGQNICEFDYSSVRQNVQAPVQPSAAETSLPGDSTKPPWWSDSKLLVAIVTTMGVLGVGYWQFGQGSRDKDKVTLVVYVKDSVSGTPIVRAKVSVQSSSVPAPGLSDDQGKVVFDLESGKGASMTIAGSAPNYEDGTLVIKASENPVDLLLKAKSPGQSVVSLPGPKPPSTPEPIGTWEVKVSGDLALRRVRSGTFDFSTMPDGRTGVAARIDLDGTAIQLEGFASRQNDRLFLTYKARSRSGTWDGQSQLDFVSGATQGFLTDAAGKQVPLTLRRP